MKHLVRPIGLLFLLLATALGFLFVVTETSALIASTKDASDKLLVSETRDQALDDAVRFLRESAGAHDELASFVIKDTDSIRVISAVEEAAKSQKLKSTIGGVSIVPTDWKYHERVRVVVSARGPFASLVSFTEILESLPEASRVENISLEASAGKEWFGTFTVDFIKEKSKAP